MMSFFKQFFFNLNKDTILWLVYRNVPPKLTSSVQQDNTSLSPIQTLPFHRIPISLLRTISCNSKLTAYYTADDSKLSTLSGHNSQFLLPKGPRQTTITEDSHSQRMRNRRGKKIMMQREVSKHGQRPCLEAERRWTETTVILDL